MKPLGCQWTRAGALLALLTCLGAHAQTQVPAADANYPSRPLRLISPFQAGQGSDNLARQLAASLSTVVQQPVTVQNLSGAGGSMAVTALLRAPADGYNLILAAHSGVVLGPLINTKLGYTDSSLQPVGLLSVDSMAIVAPSKGDLHSLDDLHKHAIRPEGVRFGMMGIGTAGHLLALELQARWSTRFILVPYKDTSQALRDLSTQELDALVLTTGSASRLINAGTVAGLAITENDRRSCIPQTRTLKEQGIDYELLSWQGLFVDADTSPRIVQRLSQDFKLAAARTEVQQVLASGCLRPASMGADEFARWIRSDARRWRDEISRLPPQLLGQTP